MVQRRMVTQVRTGRPSSMPVCTEYSMYLAELLTPGSRPDPRNPGGPTTLRVLREGLVEGIGGDGSWSWHDGFSGDQRRFPSVPVRTGFPP